MRAAVEPGVSPPLGAQAVLAAPEAGAPERLQASRELPTRAAAAAAGSTLASAATAVLA
jgi:hypothetical protein